MSLPISALLCLLISSCSLTSKQTVVSKPTVIREHVPASYLRPCVGPSKPIVTTGDIVDALTGTRGALAACNAQIAKIRKWNG